MAQFRSTINGSRGEASRLGTKASGIRTETNGWTGGVTVIAQHHDKNHPASEARGVGEHDSFEIYATTGSAWRGEADGYLGHVVNGKFTPGDALVSRILAEYAPRAAAHEV